MISSPYINLAATRLPPYLNLAYQTNGLNNSHTSNSQQSHYVANSQPQQSNRHYPNKNGNNVSNFDLISIAIFCS